MSKKRHPGWLKFASEDQRRAVLTRSVSRLKEMDEVLKARGFVHLIYISPTKEQVLHRANEETAEQAALVSEFLEKSGLHITYLLDEIDALNLTDEEKTVLFHDYVHLEREGHRVWAKILNRGLKNVIKTL